ncbi:MAG: YaaR family protein [Tissierellia bacterium]|nr:YaaR family protein [Tissierellia bacterium]
MDIKKIDSASPAFQIAQTEVVDKKTLKDTFKVKMRDLKQEEIRTELTGVYDKIEELSKRLSDKMRLEDLVEYKHQVKKFINIAVKNSHVFFKESSLDRRGRHRVYSIVKKVDLELDEITRDFIDVEQNRISILERIEEIRGIILDILT